MSLDQKQAMIREINYKIRTLNNEKAKLQRNIEEYQKMKSGVNLGISSLNSARAELGQAISELKAGYSQSESSATEVANLSNANSKIGSHIGSLSKSIEAIKGKISELKRKLI